MSDAPALTDEQHDWTTKFTEISTRSTASESGDSNGDQPRQSASEDAGPPAQSADQTVFQSEQQTDPDAGQSNQIAQPAEVSGGQAASETGDSTDDEPRQLAGEDAGASAQSAVAQPEQQTDPATGQLNQIAQPTDISGGQAAAPGGGAPAPTTDPKTGIVTNPDPYKGTPQEGFYPRGYMEGLNDQLNNPKDTERQPPAAPTPLGDDAAKAYSEGALAGQAHAREVLAQPAPGPDPHPTRNKTFYGYFKDCMGASGLPAPDTIFGSATAAVATIGAIEKAVKLFGAGSSGVTIGELIGAGALADGLAAASGCIASFYVGACVGCVAAATAEKLTD